MLIRVQQSISFKIKWEMISEARENAAFNEKNTVDNDVQQ